MKKLATLLLAAGLVFGAATGASAIDFKAKGNFTMDFDYGHGSTFVNTNRAGVDTSGYGGRGNNAGGADEFSTTQRVRLQLDVVASESLSGTVYFEIGTANWGKADTSALGADQTIVKVKNAYLDWIVPNTDLKVRMGLQGLALPSFAQGGSMIFDEDVAGVVLTNKFNDNVTLTAFWARPYNDNFTGSKVYGDPASFMDNTDVFGLLLPMSFDGVKVTPWAMVAAMGPNTLVNKNGWNSANYFSNFGDVKASPADPTAQSYGNAVNNVLQGMNPAVAALRDGKSYRPTAYTTPMWFGLTGEVTAWDPFRLAWDFNYGHNGAEFDELKRSGWYGTLLAEYKLDWATPGLYVWYASGDDGDITNGSERMPVFRPNSTNQYSAYAGTGSPQISRDGVLGNDFTGTWGIGARLKDMSFLENLKHTFAINFFNGTNDTVMAQYILGKKVSGNWDRSSHNLYTDFNTSGSWKNNDLYLTTQDYALEFNLINTYKIYDNLTLYTNLSYMALWLDQSRSVWGGGYKANGEYLGGNSMTDAWNMNVSFMYNF